MSNQGQLFPSDSGMIQRLSAFVTKNSNSDLSASDFCIVADAIFADITITLHPNTGNWYRIKKSLTSTYQVIVTTSNTKTIDDQQTLVISSPGDAVDLMLDELGNWKIF